MAVRIFESNDAGAGGRKGNVRVGTDNVVQAAMTPTATSAQSAAFAATTEIVTVQADEAVHVKLGANPTATTNDFKINAGETHDFSVPGGNYRLAVRTA